MTKILKALIIAAMCTASFALGGLVTMSVAAPRLVGYGCDGSTGPLYADEEDHFPRCAAIGPRL